jgi:hypothetical protein
MTIKIALASGAISTFIAVAPTAVSATAATAASPAAVHVMKAMVSGGLRLKARQIPVSSLSPTLRAHLAHSSQISSAAVTGYAFINSADNFCLNANNAGSTAGKNGDKVQLWACYNSPNEYWIPVHYYGSLYWLVNAQYQSKCLNADNSGGLANGRHVQLWNCYGATNEYWDFGDWYAYVNGGSVAPLFLDGWGTPFCLDADKYHLGNGDQVEIWNYYGNTNQLWY